MNLAEGDSVGFIVLILLFLLNKLSKKAPPRLCTGVKAASWISQEISADDLTGLAEKQPPFQKVTSTAHSSVWRLCAGLQVWHSFHYTDTDWQKFSPLPPDFSNVIENRLVQKLKFVI